MNQGNVMRAPKIEKVVVNIGVGQGGDQLTKAESLLTKLTERKPVRTVSSHKIPAWDLREGEPIGAKVTLRGKPAEEFLARAFSALDKRLKAGAFDKGGNFAFGLGEYIDMPGLKYDPDIGIMGFNVTVTMERPGFRIKRRKAGCKKVHSKTLVSREESIDFVKQKFGVEVE